MKVFKNILKALFIVAGLLAMFAPYEYEKEENGDFTYKAWLLGIRRKTEEDKKNYRISFFTKPKIKRAKHVLPDLEDGSDFTASEDELSDLADDISESLSELE